MKKFIIITILSLMFIGCSNIDSKNFNKNEVAIGIIIEAEQVFNADSTLEYAVITYGNYDYIVNKNLTITHKYYINYNTSILAGVIIFSVFFFFLGGILMDMD